MSRSIRIAMHDSYRIIQEGRPIGLKGYVSWHLGLCMVGGREAFAFVVRNQLQSHIVRVFDEPRRIASLAPINEIIKVDSAIARSSNEIERADLYLLEELSLFELHVDSREQLQFFGPLDDLTLLQIGFRITIEEEE